MENMWRRDLTYTSMVHQACGDVGVVQDLGELCASLSHVRESMQSLEASEFGSVRKNLTRLRCELEQEHQRSLHTGPSRVERNIMSHISGLLSREEMMEKQRSRIDWLMDDDRNTAFYQAKAHERAQSNRIMSLLATDGSMVTELEELEVVARVFYTDMFTAQAELDPEEILRHVPQKVTLDMNSSLIKPYTAAEVECALFMMGASKAPSPDGFHVGFYQLHWDVLGPDVTTVVLDFLNGGVLLEVINKTTIALIPKVKHPQEMKNYRPISHCNVIYKLCSKVIVNRLRSFLYEIVSEEHSAFIPGRLITDNV